MVTPSKGSIRQPPGPLTQPTNSPMPIPTRPPRDSKGSTPQRRESQTQATVFVTATRCNPARWVEIANRPAAIPLRPPSQSAIKMAPRFRRPVMRPRKTRPTQAPRDPGLTPTDEPGGDPPPPGPSNLPWHGQSPPGCGERRRRRPDRRGDTGAVAGGKRVAVSRRLLILVRQACPQQSRQRSKRPWWS